MFENDQDPLNHKSCWILSDGRPGHRNQSLGLAAALGIKNLQIKELTFKKFGKLLGYINIQWKFKEKIQEPYPDILIGCGSHISPLTAYIKRRSPTSFVIHLMNMPNSAPLFDVIAVPAHSTRTSAADNVMTTQGALNHIQPKYLADEAKRWESRLRGLPQKRITLLLGGNSKHFQMNEERIQTLASDVTAYAKKEKAGLLISTSRRTPKGAADKLCTSLDEAKVPYYLWNANTPDSKDNPYHAFLGAAESIIVTADSVSMLSEAATSGKKTLLWGRAFMQKAKFQRFYEGLLAQNAVVDFEVDTPSTKTQPLKEATRVAGFVRSRFFRK